MERKKILKSAAVILIITTMFLSSTPVIGEENQNDFILPPWGGGMVHSDPQLTDNIRLPVPTKSATKNVGEVWYRHFVGGEIFGTWGNGVAGNGRIAACSFNNYFGGDNLIIYDYHGKRLWSSGQGHNWSLDCTACSSTPMVDIYDRVIACDNKKIISVNASDQNNIHVEWVTNMDLNLLQFPLSPTIVMNKTIILPIMRGPLLAFNVSTGDEIARLSFWDNSSSGSYLTLPDMTSSGYSSVLSNLSMSPYHYNRHSQTVEWISPVPYGLMPATPVFYEDNVMFITEYNGVVTAIDTETGATLAITALGSPELLCGHKLYTTANSACVQGNRVYVTTQYPPPTLFGIDWWSISGRLYAVNVNPDAPDPADRLTVAWDFSFPGTSQASPTLIGDTLFFDGYNSSSEPENRDPHIYAVRTDGTLRWKRQYDNMTAFSFSKDPRGGFWYEDSGLEMHGGGGRRLVHFNENGGIIENISLEALLNDPEEVYPCSCMTICGTETQPIMLISANHDLCVPGKWVVAIDLSNNNQILWKVPVREGLLHCNIAGGQYTILLENDEPRVVCQTVWGGVMAIGRLKPNCWFDNISSVPLESQSGIYNYNDSINIDFSLISSEIQDPVWIKAMLISQDFPRLCLPNLIKNYTITSLDIRDNLTLTLVEDAPVGMYTLKLYLYNSTNMIQRNLLTIPDYEDNGIYTNDIYTTEYFLHPHHFDPRP